MEIPLSKEWEDYILCKIDDENYLCRSEVVIDALRLLKERDVLVAYRRYQLGLEIDKGFESFLKHGAIDGPTAMKCLKEKLDNRMDTPE